MRVIRFTESATGSPRLGVLDGSVVRPLAIPTLTDLIEQSDPIRIATGGFDGGALPLEEVRLLAPIDAQEVWAAGVTYRRSHEARREESESSADLYDRVYEADRPELFFKATPHRVAGPGGAIRIRADARWNVPEPELALVVSSRGRLVGFTIGNDVSSRDIEGENPSTSPRRRSTTVAADWGRVFCCRTIPPPSGRGRSRCRSLARARRCSRRGRASVD